MAQFVAQVLSDDDEFQRRIGRLLRSGPVPVSVIEDRKPREGAAPDFLIVDIRGDASSAMAGIERLRAAAPSAGILAVAPAADPALILQSRRAGPNAVFTWPPAAGT